MQEVGPLTAAVYTEMFGLYVLLSGPLNTCRVFLSLALHTSLLNMVVMSEVLKLTLFGHV